MEATCCCAPVTWILLLAFLFIHYYVYIFIKSAFFPMLWRTLKPLRHFLMDLKLVKYKERESESFIKINSTLLLFVTTPCKVLIRRHFFAIPFIFYSFPFFLVLIILMGWRGKYTSQFRKLILPSFPRESWAEEMRNYPNGSNWCNSPSDFAFYLFLQSASSWTLTSKRKYWSFSILRMCSNGCFVTSDESRL